MARQPAVDFAGRAHLDHGARALPRLSPAQHQAASGEQGFRGGIHLVWGLVQRHRWLIGLAMAAAMLAGGVALFVLSAHPSGGQSAPDSGAAATVIAAGAAAAGLGSPIALKTGAS